MTSAEVTRPSESSTSLRSRLRTEAVQRAPIAFVHTAPEQLWNGNDAEATAKLLLASLGDERLTTSITKKLLKKPHPEVDLRLDRVAEVYQEALKDAKDLPTDTKRRLGNAVAALPFDPIPLDLSVKVLGSLAHEYGDETPAIPFRFDPLALLDQPFVNVDDLEQQIPGDTLKAHRFYDNPEVTIATVTEKIADWAARPDGGKKVAVHIGDGLDIYAADLYLYKVFEALSQYPEEQRTLLDRLVRDNVSLAAVMEYIKEGFFGDKPDAERVYQQMANLRPEMIAFDGIQIQLGRGEYHAKQGNIDEARQVANKVQYSEYSYIMMFVAKNQHKNGDTDQAIATLDDVFAKDPLIDFFDTADPEEHTGTMGSNPRGFVLERLSEAYMSFGAIPQTVKAINESQQYGAYQTSTNTKIGELAVQQNTTNDLLTYITSDETRQIPLGIRADIAITCLREANKAWGLKEEKKESLAELYRIADPLVEELRRDYKNAQDSLSIRMSRDKLMFILSQTGKADEAIRLLPPLDQKRKFTMENGLKDIIATIAYLGFPKKALDIYSNKKGTFIEGDIEPLRSVIEASVLSHEDETAQLALAEVPNFDISKALYPLYKDHGEAIDPVPDWLIEKFLSRSDDDERDSSRERLKRVASYT